MHHFSRFPGRKRKNEKKKKCVLQCVFEKMKIEYAVSMSFFQRYKSLERERVDYRVYIERERNGNWE